MTSPSSVPPTVSIPTLTTTDEVALCLMLATIREQCTEATTAHEALALALTVNQVQSILVSHLAAHRDAISTAIQAEQTRWLRITKCKLSDPTMRAFRVAAQIAQQDPDRLFEPRAGYGRGWPKAL